MVIYHFLLLFVVVLCKETEVIKWCVINEAERAKCDHLSETIKDITEFSEDYKLICITGKEVFDCMLKINKRIADMMSLDVGLGYYAVQNYGMRAMGMESYNQENDKKDMNFKYVATAVIGRGTMTSPMDLRGGSSCHAGTGTAEGWIYPVARMMDADWLKVNLCNSEVKIVDLFFSLGSCAPGSQFTIFNALGDNSESSCDRCATNIESRRYCTSHDPYAGNAGALQCLENERREQRKSVAFVRGDVTLRMIKNNDFDPTQFELLCPDKQEDGTYVAPLDQMDRCNWGKPQSRMLMTQLMSDRVSIYQNFIIKSIYYFGPDGIARDRFKLFDSKGPYNFTDELLLELSLTGDTCPPQPSYDLMFSDSTMNIYFPSNNEMLDYSDVMNPELEKALDTLQNCPYPGIKWCVISTDELDKCGSMRLALNSQHLRPEFHCVLGKSTSDCIQLISDGFADVTTLDAAEMYIGGKYFGLVPIAIEYYGDRSHYYAVAVAKREDMGLLISNWKDRNICLGGAGKAVGWVIPMSYALRTNQFRVENESLIDSFAQLVSRACVPGILDEEFARNVKHPINICELCSAGLPDLCYANGNEAYYIDTGAFNCLVEVGELAFMRHYTVHDNTDGRNVVDWARSRRSDDYELVCPDGSRTNIHNWKQCNLGKISGNFVVTSGFKSQHQRDNIWTLLRFAQELFATDSKSAFAMFYSSYNRFDLMFSDSATALKQIPAINQSYQIMLEPSWIRMIETLENLSKPGHSGFFRP